MNYLSIQTLADVFQGTISLLPLLMIMGYMIDAIEWNAFFLTDLLGSFLMLQDRTD